MTNPTTIDLTPAVLTTPEGVARVNAAVRAVEQAQLRMADVAREYVTAKRRGDRDEMHEIMADMIVAEQKWSDASADFLRVMSGR